MGQQDFSRVKDLINSDDVSVIKVTAENFLLTEMPDQIVAFRSEERRVGKECRSRWSPYH